MIPAPSSVTTALKGSYVSRCRVESWFNGDLIASDIPVASGYIEVDRSVAVPERLSLTVPAVDGDGFVWAPNPLNYSHPLAPWGQRLRVSIGVEVSYGVVEWIPQGWFVITETSTEGDTVTVTGEGLLSLIEEARFATPYQPGSGSTFTSTVRKLCEPTLTVVFDAALTDRNTPAWTAWDSERLDALYEVLNAWPADCVVTNEGYLLVSPVADPTSVSLYLTDGNGGTLVERSQTLTRDGSYTMVVARGQDSTGKQIQGVAYDTTGGALADRSTFNPLSVPYYFESPLLTTVQQCQAAAQTTLVRLRREARRDLGAEIVPNPCLEVGDLVEVYSDRYGIKNYQAVIETMKKPLTPKDGAMEVKLRSTGVIMVY